MSVFRQGLFKGKVAIVTGGATGIGKAITQELVTLGCKVVIASRNENRLKAAARELNPDGALVIPKVCNIRKEDQVRHLITTTVSELGGIDFLVNNGGGQFPSPSESISLKGWNAVIETNLTGTFLMCREVFNHWMQDHGGVIVNIIADYFRGFPLMGHTGAARAGVDSLTKTLAMEWVENGVRINSIAPGSNIYSPTAEANYGGSKIFDQVRAEVPMKRVGNPLEVASAVTFLLSPGASFITGATLRVDGGSSLYARFLKQIPEHDKHPAYCWEYIPYFGSDNNDDGDQCPNSKL